MIEKMIRDDVEALSLWTAATKRKAGRPASDETLYNVQDNPPPAPMGNSREVALRSLNKAAAEGNEEAVEVKLGEQRRFVLWWDVQTKRKHEIHGNARASSISDGVAAADFDLDRDTIHRWRKRLKDPRKPRAGDRGG